MAGNVTRGKWQQAGAEAAARSFAIRPVAELIRPLVKPAFRRRSAGGAAILADWDMIVGPGIAAVTRPRRLFAGTLTIACAGPIALELQHATDALMARINTHIGQVGVTRLRFVQEPLLAPDPPLPPVVALAGSEASEAVAAVPAGPLRDALESLGQVVLAPRR